MRVTTWRRGTVSQLAHANGGELRAVDPEQADGRARFELSLPLAAEEPAEAGDRAPAAPNAIPHGVT